MSQVHAYTSFSFSYLQRARVLSGTLRNAHPDWEIWAIITDEPPPGFDVPSLHRDFDHVVFSSQLEIPEYQSWIFKHDIVEACTAVKATALRMILSRGADKVIYLDPDIAVFHDLFSIVDKLDNKSIILTPHQVEANSDKLSYIDNEYTSLKFGVFNLGFLGVKNDASGNRFASWWEERLLDACYDEPENGIFTDQKYCDLAPGLFDGVCVERDPGCNVASWNLSTRRLRIGLDGAIFVNESLLKFYHFTKITSVGGVMTQRYADGGTEIFELVNWYKREIAKYEHKEIPQGWWKYSTFSNRHLIPKKMRILYRGQKDLMESFRDPFRTGRGSFHEYVEQNYASLLEPNSA